MYVNEITEQTEPGTYRQKVAYSEAVNIRKALVERGYKEFNFDKWDLRDTDGSFGNYNIGSGEFVLTLKTARA
jgi:hypothetical protein